MSPRDTSFQPVLTAFKLKAFGFLRNPLSIGSTPVENVENPCHEGSVTWNTSPGSTPPSHPNSPLLFFVNSCLRGKSRFGCGSPAQCNPWPNPEFHLRPSASSAVKTVFPSSSVPPSVPSVPAVVKRLSLTCFFSAI